MSNTRPLCKRYERLDDLIDIDRLPAQRTSDTRTVRHGYVVDMSPDLRFFFDAIEPALTFGRAARMSHNVSGYRVVRAAKVVQYCLLHHIDESVYMCASPESLDRKPGEKEVFARFAAGVRPESSHWHGAP